MICKENFNVVSTFLLPFVGPSSLTVKLRKKNRKN